MDDELEAAQQPRCDVCAVVMREHPNGCQCPVCGVVECAELVSIHRVPVFTGLSVYGG